MNKKIVDQASKLHEEGFNCSESVLLLTASEWGIRNKIFPRIATGFGGGMGRKGYICGALSGGVIALGARYGRDRGADTAARDKTYTLVRELFKKFEDEFGSVNCRELTGCDLTTSEGRERLKKLHEEKCAKYISRTAELVLELASC